MTIFIYKLLLGFIVSSFIGSFSYITHLLTKSGVLAVILIGTLICGFGPWISWLLIVLFFASSGCIQLVKKLVHQTNESSITEKNNTRDAWQVLANSFPSLVCLILFFFTQNELFLIAFVSGIAGATADTWASEIGILSKKPPRSIITLNVLEPGLSGGVSLLGSISSFFGSFLIAGVFALVYPFYFVIPFICGVIGSLVDSFLGATIQVKYRCLVCGTITEKTIHHQQSTQKISGFSWLANDWVNFLSGVFTVLLSIIFWFI